MVSFLLTQSHEPTLGSATRERRGYPGNGDRVRAMTVHAPHETIEVRVQRGRIGRDDWDLLCRKLGFVEASSVVHAAGVEVVREGGGERAPGWTVGTFARRLVEGFR